MDECALQGDDVDGEVEERGLLLRDDDAGLDARGVADGALLGADVDEEPWLTP